MNPLPEAIISAFLRRAIDAGDFPSAVYLVAEHGRAIFADALGDAVRVPEAHPATLETIYDLASLTKPLITTLLCARLIETGELKLDGVLGDYLPDFGRSDKSAITVRQLLTHTSGLPAWRPLYLLAPDKAGALKAIADGSLEYDPGTRVIYSDVGFIVLGFLLQSLTGISLAELAQRKIFMPLKLQNTFFNPARAMQTGIAACEGGNAYERDMCERGASNYGAISSITDYSGWRTEVIWGQVHDGNAYFLGGAAGHAGLFSNAIETFKIANQFIANQSELLSRDTTEFFRQNLTPGLNEARSLGWQLAATKDSTAGPSLPAYAFGHTGFTGASCWVDSARERVFILLTNRTHNHSLPFANINAVRREFHSLAVAALTSR